MGDLVRTVEQPPRVDFPKDQIDYIRELVVPDLMDWRKDSYGKQISFLGNRRVKPGHTTLDYTEDHIREIIKCKNDPFYFSKYFYIIHKDRGREAIKLYDFQYSLLQHFVNNRFTVSLLPRQCGKTTVATIAILHQAMFNKDQAIGILSYKAKGAADIMNRIRMAYQMLPNWLKLGIVEWNKMSVVFENGSSIFAEATSEDSFTGKSLNMLVFDEVSKVRPNLFETLYASIYPTISSGQSTRIMMFSTPLGLNHWWTLCDEAQKKINGYEYFYINWDEVPGRDEAWRVDEIKRIGPRKFEQEYECQFLGSGQTLISGESLRKLSRANPIEETDRYRIYEHYRPGRFYVAGVDTSRGLEQDFHAIQILDITDFPIRQVAVFHANDVLVTNFIGDAYSFLGKYRFPMCMIENNDAGGHVADGLFNDFEYEMVYWERKEPGFKTTGKSKRQMLILMKDLIENDKFIINDGKTIQELCTYVRSGSSFNAEQGHNDDLVMGLAVAIYSFKTEWVDVDNLTQKISAKQDVDFGNEVDDIVVMGDDYTEEDDTKWLTR